jgi:hypothetical protein
LKYFSVVVEPLRIDMLSCRGNTYTEREREAKAENFSVFVRYPSAGGRRKARQSEGTAQIAKREIFPFQLLMSERGESPKKSNNKLETQTMKFSYLGLSYDSAFYCCTIMLKGHFLNALHAKFAS